MALAHDVPKARGEVVTMNQALDDDFYEKLKGKPSSFALRAIAAYVCREAYGDNESVKQGGLARAFSEEETEAWLFGWEWVDRKG